jgi:hypothetical protein
MGIPGTIDPPRPEDFGVDAGEIDTAPEPFITRFRYSIFVILYATILVVAFLVLYRISGSIPASMTFAVIGVGALSIVLVPILMCVVCACEKAEIKWMCRRFPALERCLDYREALADFMRRGARSPEPPHDRSWWSGLSPTSFRAQVGRDLESRGLDLEPVADRGAAGFDYTLRDGDETVLVRCEAGPEQVEVGVARELVACIGETDADRAIVVTPGGASTTLGSYLVDHPITVVDPMDLPGDPPAEP